MWDLVSHYPYKHLQAVFTIVYRSHSDRPVVIFHCGFNLYFLMASDVKLFMCLFAIHTPLW